MEQLLTVASFNEFAPAEMLKDRLIAAGLNADILDDSGAQAALFSGKEPRAHMKVRVRKHEAEKALELLAEWEKEGLLREAVHCPQCGSSRVEFPQFSRDTSASMFFGALAAVKLIPREFYCENCQFTWPDKVEAEIERDALNWPK